MLQKGLRRILGMHTDALGRGGRPPRPGHSVGLAMARFIAGVGENWLEPTGGHGCPFPKPPPLLARRDGAMTTGIHSPPVPPLPPTVVVFMSGLFRLHPINININIKRTKKAKVKILWATGFEPRISRFECQYYYQLSYVRI